MTVLGRIDPPWDQRLARILVRPLIATPVTPNQITTVSLLFGLACFTGYAAGGPWVHWAAGCYMAAAFIDHMDGELARATGRTSRFGHLYDNVVGGINYFALFFGMGLGLADGPYGAWAVLAGVAAGVAVAFIVSVRLELERRQGKTAIDQPNLAGFEIEDILYVVGPVTWFGSHDVFVLLAGVGAPAFMAWQVWQFARHRRAPKEMPG